MSMVDGKPDGKTCAVMADIEPAPLGVSPNAISHKATSLPVSPSNRIAVEPIHSVDTICARYIHFYVALGFLQISCNSVTF